MKKLRPEDEPEPVIEPAQAPSRTVAAASDEAVIAKEREDERFIEIPFSRFRGSSRAT
jgi:hypothetical protein